MYIQNYTLGEWQNPVGNNMPQYDALTGEQIGIVGDVADFAAVADYGRRVGGKALRHLRFFERGLMLKQLALYLTERKEHYYTVSARTGATRADSWIDIDGGIGNLFAYASLRRHLGNETFYVEDEAIRLSKGGSFLGLHVCVPKPGVAFHINAFNFPVWGMLEKCAVNWLAGVPAIVKASEITSFVTEVVVRDIVASGILPEGALQFIGGSGRGLLDAVEMQDVVTFTGSAATGHLLKANPRLLSLNVPFNMEADSLNAMVLGPDVAVGSPDFDIFVKNVQREIVVKTGQKCTAVRRIIVPTDKVEAVQAALVRSLGSVKVGNPAVEGVRMGALVSAKQRERVYANLEKLLAESQCVTADVEAVEVIGANRAVGTFMPPVLLRNDYPLERLATHTVEAFGPVATLMPYHDLAAAAHIANLGRGSLVCTLCTANAEIARDYLMVAGPYHGRMLLLNEASAKESTGHGSPMPLLAHGGPGRAGGGEEMGGIRGVKHYLQRVALQGDPTLLTQTVRQYQPGAERTETDIHPFQHYFEDLEVGYTRTTHRHTVTETDIVNFANLTGDHFYAHVDVTSLEGTPFTQRVAHGYYLLSKAAGMFVEPRKGPVLLNYGLESCRFTKPVYPGTTIGVKLTVREKVDTEQKTPDDVPKGIVKWWVEIYDDTQETVAIATILTMVRKRVEQA